MICGKAIKPILLHLALAGILLAVMLTGARPSHAQGKAQAPAPPVPQTTRQLTPKEWELINEQTRYYKNQADELERTKDFRGKIEANPVAIAAVLGAFATIFLGLLNLMQARRSQRDTQFYEALKRFGDPSPAVRSSAAGLIAQMGREHKRYFVTTLDQLLAGVALETSDVVLSSIEQAILHIIACNPSLSLQKCHVTNVFEQLDMTYRLADFFAAKGVTPENIPDEMWRTVASATEYPESVLKALVDGRTDQFERAIISSPKAAKRIPKDRREGVEAELVIELWQTATHLRTSGWVYAQSLHQVRPIKLRGRTELAGPCLAGLSLDNMDFQHSCLRDANFGASRLNGVKLGGADLSGALLKGATLLSLDERKVDLQHAKLVGAQLQGATLAGVQLQGANLLKAQLQGASFTGVNMDKAKIYGAETSDSTTFTTTNWWAADFNNVHGMPDTKLRKWFYEHFGQDAPRGVDEVHPSLRSPS